jgi:hypothetical protein
MRTCLRPLGPQDVVRVPTAIENFAKQFAFEGEPVREWAQRLYDDVRRWTPCRAAATLRRRRRRS